MSALDDAKRQLYSADPSEFVRSRDRLAAEARQRGAGELASSIKKLRRPDIAAHAVNLLVRHEEKRIDALAGIGERLRKAQRNLRGEDVRQLDGERSQLLGELVDRAGELVGAGRSLGTQARRQVEQTLQAMVSDPESAGQVRSGALTKPLEYSGFGLDEVSTAALRNSGRKAAKSAGARERGPTRRKQEDGAEAGRRSRARPSREESGRKRPAEGVAKVAAAPEVDGREESTGRAGGARGRRRERDVSRERAEELHRAEDDLRHAESEQRRAEREHARLSGQLEEVERKLRKAERELTAARERADDARKRREAAAKRRPGGRRSRS